MRNFVIAALIGSTSVQAIKLNMREYDPNPEWKGSTAPIQWHSHGEYDTTRFEQDYVDAKNNFTERRRELQEEFEK